MKTKQRRIKRRIYMGKITMTDCGVTAAKGFFAAGIEAGIKKDRADMAVLYSESPCEAAGVYTKNLVKAAPVVFDKMRTDCGSGLRGVVVNSGVANACTGKDGMDACLQTAEAAENVFKVPSGSFCVASTGVIGRQLPMDKILGGIPKLHDAIGSSREAAHSAARAIMTTDTKPKEVSACFEVDGTAVSIGGMCKGSGMIHPNMGTMLCFIATDACISHELLQEALSENVTDTFNMVSVDGDTSTNDTVLVFANGQSGCGRIEAGTEAYATFKEALRVVMEELAKKIAGDGEGCTCLFEVKMLNCATKETARTLAKSVVSSLLTKAAIFGSDANWGRILCAMGYAGVDFDPEKVDLWFESAAGKVQIAENGRATDYSEEFATKILSEDAVTAIADVKQGSECAVAWGCDLTHEYVSINADYRS
jgi:glutamate N-acetyltransferase/amino-acid N-acetyltransferase